MTNYSGSISVRPSPQKEKAFSGSWMLFCFLQSESGE
jgi:hypothetical protein